MDPVPRLKYFQFEPCNVKVTVKLVLRQRKVESTAEWLIFDPVCGVFLIAIFTYFIGTEGLFGFTLRKRITRILVVSEEGRKITMKQSAIRNLCRLIDVIAIYIIGIRIARMFPLLQLYGDKFAQTVVVRYHQ